ncbi:pentapeptide repeat-containing protein [Actinomadura rugatobispora]|uniref:Pentapeptide repeat-containing protein n=1 Tax=Actinomadura rugatobispora TaxID=1994 RepID=A0ABW0ZN88_9ACTN
MGTLARAVERLGSAEMGVRLDGIDALMRLADDSPSPLEGPARALEAFVRRRAPASRLDDRLMLPTVPRPRQTAGPEADVQAALTALGRVPRQHHWLDLSGLDLSRARLGGLNLSYAHLYAAELCEADLRHTNLRNAHLAYADLSGARLEGAILSRTVLIGANLSGADLREADLHGLYLCDVTLHEVDLSGADLVDADLRGVRLDGVDLLDADLSGANLRGTVMTGVRGMTLDDLQPVAWTDERTWVEERPAEPGLGAGN